MAAISDRLSLPAGMQASVQPVYALAGGGCALICATSEPYSIDLTGLTSRIGNSRDGSQYLINLTTHPSVL